ncbi:precorrin-6y C5,15-methyltransferase (decarboxylating) subunit CbiE [Photobacterium sanguinicancri]|uniref:precorrin-6y C5,15-methyltransferase (decarboxylating) subunit CbiE n=2 Tax=Photobacterium sanguinicancri TaxID=875932 RepID=UPI0021C3591F|nr:precorrin-6y C5,15-methyltransferase (decarboxylating) subunit CbiE [Photobacterium sanguinicancri]
MLSGDTNFSEQPAITVVGVPEDGCMSLTSRAVNAVAQARIIAGNDRLLTWFPQCKGKRLSMAQGYKAWLTAVLEESEEGGVVILASGDPLFYGIGKTLSNHLPTAELRFIPSPSSMQLAFSRLALPWQDATCLSVHGRPLTGLVSQMQQGDLFCVLTDSNNHPAAIAKHLLTYHQPHWQIWVCEQLGGIEEKVTSFTVAELATKQVEDFNPLNLVVLQRQQALYWGGYGQYAADDTFEKRMPKRGLITKQPIRHLALSSMRIRPDHSVWDIGTGSGSVAIEAAKQCWQGQVYTLESNNDCYESIEANIAAHATDNVQLLKVKAPEELASLPQPKSVFIGGSRGEMAAILDSCWQRLADDGVIVATAVTIDSVAELHTWSKQRNVKALVQMVSVSQGVPLAHYTRYQAENPIHLFIFDKRLQTELHSENNND